MDSFVNSCLLVFFWPGSLPWRPVGESVLYTGLYRVALKKFTTPRTRALAFAVSYAISNLAGAIGDLMLDIFRGMGDLTFTIGGEVRIYTGARLSLLATWIATLAALIICAIYLHDVTVLDNSDPEPGMASKKRLEQHELLGDDENGTKEMELTTSQGGLEEGVAAEHPSKKMGLWQAILHERRLRLKSYRIVATGELHQAAAQSRKEAHGRTSTTVSRKQEGCAYVTDLL
eukprot:2460564-Amphidinium_carterae.1